MLGEPIPTNADAILARMRADREVDWPTRLRRSIEATRDDLSLRELQVLRCASVGLTEALTGDALGITAGTVGHYRDTARLRLGAKNTVHAVSQALRLGLIE